LTITQFHAKENEHERDTFYIADFMFIFLKKRIKDPKKIRRVFVKGMIRCTLL